MWGMRLGREARVTCIACGTRVARSDAREYDKEGDRWERTDKEFEHLCTSCYNDIDHHPRGELERLLLDIEGPTHMTHAEFIHRYHRLVEERYGHSE